MSGAAGIGLPEQFGQLGEVVLHLEDFRGGGAVVAVEPVTVGEPVGPAQLAQLDASNLGRRAGTCLVRTGVEEMVAGFPDDHQKPHFSEAVGRLPGLPLGDVEAEGETAGTEGGREDRGHEGQEVIRRSKRPALEDADQGSFSHASSGPSARPGLPPFLLFGEEQLEGQVGRRKKVRDRNELLEDVGPAAPAG